MRAETNRTSGLADLLAPLLCFLLVFGCEQPRSDAAGPDGATPKESASVKILPKRKPPASPLPALSPTVLPNVAGSFYPGTAEDLRREVQGYLRKARGKRLKDPWAVIAPHAGYRFSGPVAGSAFAPFTKRSVRRVVVVAFAHDPYRSDGSFKHPGLATVLAKGFRTPLGDLPVDEKEVRALLAAHPEIGNAPELAVGEHSLEVQLPFIQVAMPQARLVPIFFGLQRDAGLAETLGKILKERYAGRPDTVVVISTDFSHYFSYEQAVEMDAHSLKLIHELNGDALLSETMKRRSECCGLLPVLALLHAQKLSGGATPVVLDSRNSGDTFGDKKRVVGYAAVAFPRPSLPRKKTANSNPVMEGKIMDYTLNETQKNQLIEIARKTVRSYVTRREVPDFEITDPLLLEKGATFVTLKKDGDLRGCIGHTEAHVPLWRCVREMAMAACSQDPRFPAVREEELPALSYEVTVLTPLQKVEDLESIVVGRDGLMMERGYNRGLLLPQVPVEWNWNREEFLSHTAMKAGLSPDAWRDGSVTVYSFQGLVFGDEDPAMPGTP